MGISSAKKIMASSDTAAIRRARQLLDQNDLEVWNGGRKKGALSARRRTSSFRIFWRGLLSRVIGALRVFRSRSVEATVVKSISTREPLPRARSIDWTTPLNQTTRP